MNCVVESGSGGAKVELGVGGEEGFGVGDATDATRRWIAEPRAGPPRAELQAPIGQASHSGPPPKESVRFPGLMVWTLADAKKG